MGDPRIFLDFSKPALHTAAELLIQKSTTGHQGDLRNTVVVLPTSQACRRLLELLTEKSSDHFYPPKIITVGALPELLYAPKKPFATRLTQIFAWADALKALRREDLELIIPLPPNDYDVDAWLNLGELLSRQHRELAADGLDFEDVAKRGSGLEAFNEVPRWKVLAEVQRIYLTRLDDLGLWDQQTARLFAIEHHECQTENEIVLVGTSDLNQTLHGMLEAVRSQVRVMIHAPPEWADRFDEFGSLIPHHWTDVEIAIDDSSVTVVEGPQEQAAQVALELAQYSGAYAIDEVSLSVPDHRIIPHLKRTLHQFDVPVNWSIEKTVSRSGPFLLLEAIADYLGSDRTDDFSKLIRHPDLSEWIDQQALPGDWLTRWDAHLCEHLQRRTLKILGTGKNSKTARELVGLIGQLLKPLRGAARTLEDWFPPIRTLLLKVYGERELDRDRHADRLLFQSVELILDGWETHADLPDALTPVATARQAILLTLDQLQGELLIAGEEEPAVHLSGWLDMALDDAPVAILTSMNEGFVPTSMNHDLFLPNRLRAFLGIEDNDRRFARDAYSLSAILASRERVKLIAARRDARKEPLTPSRLLFAADTKTVAQRIVSFFESGESWPVPRVVGLSTSRQESDFKIPRPELLAEERRSFRVTEFRDYLASPYRYYLRHFLGLEDVSDEVVELDPAGFGSLMHDVLQAFGLSDVSANSDPLKINSFLNSELDRLVKKRYGTDSLFPISVQIEQIRQRLDAFANWQAEWVKQGWRIRFTEVGQSQRVDFPLKDGTSISLRGRIDRIDVHEKSGEWVIFDYKTGDRGNSPQQSHQKQGAWIDLQLPLYRHLARPLGVQGSVRLGYITLPRTVSLVGEQIADWTEEELLTADEVTRETAQKIIRQEFWVQQDRPVKWFDEFAGICQDGVFGQEVLL